MTIRRNHARSISYALVFFVLGIGCQRVQAQSTSRRMPAPSTSVKARRAGLQGYCPVCVLKMKKWVKGRAEFQSQYDGITYFFPGADQKRMFDQNPAQFVPALGGDCTVCYALMDGQRVPGSVQHAVLFGGRLFLFPADKQKQEFRSSPTKFADVDLALNGDCAVCLVHMNKRVPGKQDFMEIHDGLRYQFPSPTQQATFRMDPGRYAAVVTTAAAHRVSGKHNDTQTIVVSGRSSCAGCEHGISPIGSPDQLGLAIKAADGSIYVVEDAHRLYPDIYEKRFAELPLKLVGSVIQRDAKFAWIVPTELTVAN